MISLPARGLRVHIYLYLVVTSDTLHHRLAGPVGRASPRTETIPPSCQTRRVSASQQIKLGTKAKRGVRKAEEKNRSRMSSSGRSGYHRLRPPPVWRFGPRGALVSVGECVKQQQQQAFPRWTRVDRHGKAAPPREPCPKQFLISTKTFRRSLCV